MPEAPRKYYLINESQLQSARQHWPQVNDKTWVLVLSRADEPMMLNKPAHRGTGFAHIKVPAETVEGMFYRRDLDVLILMSGETALAS